jgi:hypothetical protein
MSKSTISTFELFQMFPDAEAARVYMEGKRWPDGAVARHTLDRIASLLFAANGKRLPYLFANSRSTSAWHGLSSGHQQARSWPLSTCIDQIRTSRLSGYQCVM